MWNNSPSFEEVHANLRSRAQLKARIRLAEHMLSIVQARIAKIAPRNTAAKILGTDDSDAEQLRAYFAELNDCRNQLDAVEAEIEFQNYHKELYKAEAYKGRV